MAIDRMKDINVFVHVAEAKSFTAAAERMGFHDRRWERA